MSAVLPASGSVKGSDVLLSIRERLVQTLELDTSLVRIVAKPSPLSAHYRAEKNLAIKLHPPEPFTNAGAGRYGQIVRRVMEVWVYTQNLSDEAGSDEKMVTGHLDFEESVVNVLTDTRPYSVQVTDNDATDLVETEHLPLTLRFLPGGSELERATKSDLGLAVSCLLFEVQYQLPYTVLRD